METAQAAVFMLCFKHLMHGITLVFILLNLYMSDISITGLSHWLLSTADYPTVEEGGRVG